MIDIKELRVGNWLQCDDGPYHVKNIWERGINFGGDERGVHSYTPYENLSGIPLTEETLLQMGFKKKRDYAIGAGGYDKWINGHFTIMPLLGEFRYLQVPNHIVLRTVHQLQNLYFATQLEELIY